VLGRGGFPRLGHAMDGEEQDGGKGEADHAAAPLG
jgi:hypothetical protein